MRKAFYLISIISVCVLSACGKAPAQDLQIPVYPIKTEITEQSDSLATKDADEDNSLDTSRVGDGISLIDPNGQELATRVLAPDGYERIPADEEIWSL